jgi:hypothetical protein
MKCYTVAAQNYQSPKISVEYPGLSITEAKLVCSILTDSFRNVDCNNELTGESMFNHYVSEDFFTPLATIPETLKTVEDALNGKY